MIVAQIYPGTKCEAYTFAIIKSQHAGCEEQSCTETSVLALLAMRTPLCFEPPLRGMIFLVEGMSSVAAKLFFSRETFVLVLHPAYTRRALYLDRSHWGCLCCGSMQIKIKRRKVLQSVLTEIMSLRLFRIPAGCRFSSKEQGSLCVSLCISLHAAAIGYAIDPISVPSC